MSVGSRIVFYDFKVVKTSVFLSFYIGIRLHVDLQINVLGQYPIRYTLNFLFLAIKSKISGTNSITVKFH